MDGGHHGTQSFNERGYKSPEQVRFPRASHNRQLKNSIDGGKQFTNTSPNSNFRKNPHQASYLTD